MLPEFKHTWEPEALGKLRDNMEYDGTERQIVQAFMEGWSDEQVRAAGLRAGLQGWAINNRGELMVYDEVNGYTTVIPHQREDIFRAIVKWLHDGDHSRADQMYTSIRRRFFWHSSEKM
eukprot:SAG31_NODE_13874_length_841_cov_0.621294_1_plen_119_part_00